MDVLKREKKRLLVVGKSLSVDFFFSGKQEGLSLSLNAFEKE